MHDRDRQLEEVELQDPHGPEEPEGVLYLTGDEMDRLLADVDMLLDLHRGK